jgi:chemotaxis family two-component system response regulator Rcp1
MSAMKTLEILLVEDNEGDVEMTERAMRDMEPACNVSVAHDGMAALDFLLKRGPHAGAPSPALIFLDLNMPRMDGKKFLEVAKADAQLRTIPVIMLTSSRSPMDIRECYERHANCYVVKPFDGKEFISAVRQIVTFWSGVVQLPA